MDYVLYKVANPIGIVGVILVLIAYLLLQLDRMSQDGIPYSLLNIIGSAFLLYSLMFFWNLASFIIEVAWFAISIYGLMKALRLRRRA